MKMCFGNITEIHDANLDDHCNRSLRKHMYDDPSAFITYFTAGAVYLVLSTVVLLKYNSVTVMNVTVHSRSVSNTSWIVYFIVSAIRSFVSGGFYMYGTTSPTSNSRVLLYFIIDNVLMSLGVSSLAWVLNHQRNYRAGGFLNQEISRFNSREVGHVQCNDRPRIKQICSQYLLCVEAVIICLFFVANIILGVLEILHAKSLCTSTLVWLYWLYLGFFWFLCIIVVILVVAIVKNTNAEGPKLCTKGLFIFGVFLTLPADIPTSVWTKCIHDLCRDSKHFISSSDLTIILVIFSVVVFFVALRQEFLRLNQEAQWSAVRDAESLFAPSL